MSIPAILETLDRAHKGPICTVRDWDSKIIFQTITRKLKEHGLAKTADAKNYPINCDDSLADAFFKAGIDLAVEVGMLCTDTERVIKVTEEEIKEALRNAPSEIIVGEGFDAIPVVARRPGDPRLPRLISPLGIVVSEDLWVTLMQGIVQNKEVDILQGGSLETVFGRQVRSATPYETIAGRVNAQLHREALWRAGRPGMGATAVISATTVFAQVGGYGIPGGFDPKKDLALVLSPAELKTAYHSLNKIVHTVNCGGRIMAGSSSMLGGYAGPMEGTALAMIASAILELPVHLSVFASCGLIDTRYNGNCGWEGMWTVSTAFQAISRNAQVLTNGIVNQVAGPVTDQILYESLVGMMNLSVSGLSSTIGPRSAGGKYSNYLTPLEAKFCGEVLKSCMQMKRDDANEIAKKVIPKYENSLREAPKGKSFTECYNVDTLKPSAEWVEIYERVRKEAIGLGVPLA